MLVGVLVLAEFDLSTLMILGDIHTTHTYKHKLEMNLRGCYVSNPGHIMLATLYFGERNRESLNIKPYMLFFVECTSCALRRKRRLVKFI